MWVDDLAALCEHHGRTIPRAFLKGGVSFQMSGRKLGRDILDRASGCLIDRFCVNSRGTPRRLVLLRHDSTPAASEYLAGALLVIDLLHSKGKEFEVSLPQAEARSLLQGDVLVVTQRVTDFVSSLQRLSIGGVKIKDMWNIQALTKYASNPGRKSRVFVSNPGWIRRAPELAAQFSAVLIDASHPRTLIHASDVLKQLSGIPVQIVICPPMDRRRIEALCNAGQQAESTVWLWDPSAEMALADTIGCPAPAPRERNRRTYLVSNDMPVNDALERIHNTLRICHSVTGNRVSGCVFEAWSIYHRLRQSVVSLLELEEAHARARSAFQLPIRKRLEQLREVELDSNPTIRAHWSHLVEQLEDAYTLLLERSEPDKFWILASFIEQIAEPDGGEAYAIVVPTEQDATVLTSMLVSLVDGAASMLEDGSLSLLTVKQEPVFLHRGYQFRTVLSGFRTYGTRYLDIFPSHDTFLITYLYEAMADEQIQSAMRNGMEFHASAEQRIAALERIGVPVGKSHQDSISEGPSPSLEKPKVVLVDGLGRQALNIERSHVVDDLALDELIERSSIGAWTGDVTAASEVSGAVPGMGSFPTVEVAFTSGDRLKVPLHSKLDVYYPASEELARMEVERLQKGDQVVLFVDDPLARLYQRFIEAIREKTDARTNAVLELWGRAKELVLQKYSGEMTQLYDSLHGKGLSVTYQALRGWFKEGEGEIIAPGRFDNFTLLAGESSVYRNKDLLRTTFAVIEEERKLHRIAGKRLRSLLRALVTPNYDFAKTVADALGSEIGELSTSISLEEVESVSR